MKAVILAGGFGTRLKSVVSERPKALAPVRNRPFIVFLLDQLIAAKVESAVLCIGYLGGKIKNCLGDKYKSLHLEYSHESKPLGTAGALKLALPFFESNSILVLNGDSYFETNLMLHLFQMFLEVKTHVGRFEFLLLHRSLPIAVEGFLHQPCF